MNLTRIPSPLLSSAYGWNKDQLAKALYPGTPYDCALPQDWVNNTNAKADFDVVPHFVWGYPKGYLFGLPLPLTLEAYALLAELGELHESFQNLLCRLCTVSLPRLKVEAKFYAVNDEERVSDIAICWASANTLAEARRQIIDQNWDVRLETTGCAPVVKIMKVEAVYGEDE